MPAQKSCSTQSQTKVSLHASFFSSVYCATSVTSYNFHKSCLCHWRFASFFLGCCLYSETRGKETVLKKERKKPIKYYSVISDLLGVNELKSPFLEMFQSGCFPSVCAMSTDLRKTNLYVRQLLLNAV